MILDYVFVVPVGMGIAGAALATGIGYCIPSVVGLVYFSINRKGSAFCEAPAPVEVPAPQRHKRLVGDGEQPGHEHHYLPF